MTRSPLFYPLNRAQESDAGGIADLQTDVMRFMAILALCLVAIFALVQSIPLAPVIESPVPVPKEEPQPVVKPEPLTEIAEPVRLTRPRPRPKLLPEPQAEERPLTIPEPVPVPVETEPVAEGFTLRFEDETALTRLVARHEVGLYAIDGQRSYRMTVNRGALSFWPASTPNQFHEMDATTVPGSVLAAFDRGSAASRATVQWGVTRPATTSRQLDAYLSEASGGALIIDADGELRLER